MPPLSLPRLQRRAATFSTGGAVALSTVVALAAAFALSGLLFLPFGIGPARAYADLFREAFGSQRGLGQSLVLATPLILIAQATVVIWRAGLGYIGFDGCFLLGAAASAYVALGGVPGDFPFALPPWAFWPAAFVACVASGAIWAALVGVMRIRFGGNDVLVSLMMNYVAALLVQYLVSGPMRAPGDLPQTPRLPVETWLPACVSFGRVHAGLALALAASLAVWFVLRFTPQGFELVASGLNPRAARYGGIAVARRQIGAMLAGGGLSGLAGLCAVLGVQHRLMDGLSGGVGFLGIVVALLARLDPLAVTPTAILFGGLQVGGAALQRQSNLPTSAVMVLECLIVLSLLATEALRQYRLVWPAPRAGERSEAAKPEPRGAGR